MKMLKTNFYISLFIMFITSFIIQYFIISWVTSNKMNNFANSLGKIYLSVLVGLLTVLVELIFNYSLYIHQSSNIFLYLFTIIFIGLTIYLYRNQVFIGDKEYLNDMIEHLSISLLPSEEILKKTDNQKVINLANRILQEENKEIKEILDLL